MKVDKTIKEEFSAVSLKKPVVIKFRNFSKKIAATHSETIEVMIDFFERNAISPFEDVGVNMIRLEKNLQKRFNAIIAIIKDIEKSQTKPTAGILLDLFEQTETKEKKPLILEKKQFPEKRPSIRSIIK